MKKTIALLIALLTLSAVGCGKVETNDPAPAETGTTTAAAETTAATTTADTETTTTTVAATATAAETTTAETTTAAETTAAETTEAPQKSAADEKVMFNDDNCKIAYQSWPTDEDEEPMPLDELDKDTVYRMADHTVQQLNAIFEQDKQRYFDLYNLRGLFKSEATGRTFLYRLSDPTNLENYYFMNAMLEVEGTRIDGLEVPDFESAATEEELMKMAGDFYSRLGELLTPENAYFMRKNNDLERFTYVYNKFSDRAEGFSSDPDSFLIRESDALSANMAIYASSKSETGKTARFYLYVDNGRYKYSIRGMAWTDDSEICVCTEIVDLLEN